jgi:hypothetical protein
MPAHMLKAPFVYSYYYSFFSAAAIFAAILRTIDYVDGESLNGNPAGFPPPLLLTQRYHIEKQKSIRKEIILVFLLCVCCVCVKEMMINCQIRVFHTFPDNKPSRSSRKA